VSSDNIALKINDVCISNTCDFDNFVTTNIPSSINECKVCLTHNECVYFEDNSSVDVGLFSNNSVSMACNLNSINANTDVSKVNNVYSGFVSLSNDFVCVGDVFPTACYLDNCNVLYGDCMFTAFPPGIAACTYIYDCTISPCMALVSNKFKMGDNVGFLCRIIANCNNVSEIVYLSHVSQFNIERNFPAKAAANLPYILCTEFTARSFLNCDVSIPGIALHDYFYIDAVFSSVFKNLFGLFNLNESFDDVNNFLDRILFVDNFCFNTVMPAIAIYNKSLISAYTAQWPSYHMFQCCAGSNLPRMAWVCELFTIDPLPAYLCLVWPDVCIYDMGDFDGDIDCTVVSVISFYVHSTF
jgi:hypothetical protein